MPTYPRISLRTLQLSENVQLSELLNNTVEVSHYERSDFFPEGCLLALGGQLGHLFVHTMYILTFKISLLTLF